MNSIVKFASGDLKYILTDKHKADRSRHRVSSKAPFESHLKFSSHSCLKAADYDARATRSEASSELLIQMISLPFESMQMWKEQKVIK